MSDSPTAIAIRAIKADALRDACEALRRGEGPDLFDGADDAYADWLYRRAHALNPA